MTLGRWSREQIYLYRHPVDMRRSIDGLAATVEQSLGLDPFEPALFVFVNKQRDKVKCLVWERNGFWLLYKRLVKQRFQWPKWFEHDSLTLTEAQLAQLLDGYDLNGMRPHERLFFKSVM